MSVTKSAFKEISLCHVGAGKSKMSRTAWLARNVGSISVLQCKAEILLQETAVFALQDFTWLDESDTNHGRYSTQRRLIIDANYIYKIPPQQYLDQFSTSVLPEFSKRGNTWLCSPLDCQIKNWQQSWPVCSVVKASACGPKKHDP